MQSIIRWSRTILSLYGSCLFRRHHVSKYVFSNILPCASLVAFSWLINQYHGWGEMLLQITFFFWSSFVQTEICEDCAKWRRTGQSGKTIDGRMTTYRRWLLWASERGQEPQDALISILKILGNPAANLQVRTLYITLYQFISLRLWYNLAWCIVDYWCDLDRNTQQNEVEA